MTVVRIVLVGLDRPMPLKLMYSGYHVRSSQAN